MATYKVKQVPQVILELTLDEVEALEALTGNVTYNFFVDECGYGDGEDAKRLWDANGKLYNTLNTAWEEIR